jgi:Beta propeller domain
MRNINLSFLASSRSRTVLISSASLVAALGAWACSSPGATIVVEKKSPDYKKYKPGYNPKTETSGPLKCAYRDSTVVRSYGAPTPQGSQGMPQNVAVGVTTIDRNAAVLEQKSAAKTQLKQSAGNAARVSQIGSCTLECVPTTEEQDNYAYASGGGSSSGASGGPRDAGASAQEASTTNNQVAGVEEGDFIKNDNKYMYVLANNTLKIIDAFPAASAKEVGSLALSGGNATKLLLDKDRLVVFSSTAGSAQKECTYGYDCVPTGDGGSTLVKVIDVSNRAAPVLVRELSYSGSLLATRRVGDAVHTVLYDAPIEERLQSLSRFVAPKAADCIDETAEFDAASKALDGALAAQEKAIDDADARGPNLKDGASNVEPSFVKSNMPGNAFITVASFGLSGGAAQAAAAMGKPGFVYASATGIYVAVPRQRNPSQGWYQDNADPSASEVLKFDIGSNAASTRYAATGLVKGTVLNQFAMDEWAGNLRIATTSGRVPDPKVHSTVSVLKQDGPALSLEGRADNIAPTEDIRSVRFEGDRGFLVTFKKTDPLFALDLGNPKDPKVAGELKIPGFSTYMHFMDRNHILAMGLEADDQGSFAYFNGVQLQIFDVRDLAAPTLLHKTVIGTRGTTSEALVNHLGFNYFVPKQALALPMTICEGGGNGSYGQSLTFNGLLLYKASVAQGFTKIGGVSHDTQGTCNNWWTNANSTVKRSVFMDDFVYSVSDTEINIASLTAPETRLAQVKLR